MGLQLLDSAHYLVCKHSMAARQRCHQRFRPGTTYAKGSCTESSVDDLGTCRGVVLSRAATILRSIETQPSTGRFVRENEQPSFGPSRVQTLDFFPSPSTYGCWQVEDTPLGKGWSPRYAPANGGLVGVRGLDLSSCLVFWL